MRQSKTYGLKYESSWKRPVTGSVRELVGVPYFSNLSSTSLPKSYLSSPLPREISMEQTCSRFH